MHLSFYFPLCLMYCEFVLSEDGNVDQTVLLFAHKQSYSTTFDTEIYTRVLINDPI